MTQLRWAAIAGILSVLTVALLVSGLLHYHSEAASAQESIKQLQREASGQAEIIASQAFSFQRANSIAATAQRDATFIREGARKKEIEYRTILKTRSTCDTAIPADITVRLLDYTNSLRTRAMHADPVNSDSARSGPTATGTLTYCQAVLWINPLLATIEQANNQLAGIREIEKVRQNAIH
ncbi:hypothetical protein SAMN05216516_11632 [Izhakiella capsodis]|uniref:Prophage endopeptidase n=1 Tax=Izhakiella capsodis TaxID=1367852 RepID=A0A1I5BDM5_9GAMM|nr:hypothetical protein [Izhakiella capsodis]SFN72814.1 hypothetical protein SAMN05216516_11632 [Izhakiella capsodis]